MTTTAPRASVYKIVTDKIIAELEAGIIPWVKPWEAGGGLSLPKNAKTGATYRGVNVLLLWSATHKNGFSQNLWLTFNQAQELKGNVRKGEKGTQIIVVKQSHKETENSEGEKEEKVFNFMKTYYVFNLDQIEGLDHLKQEKIAVINNNERNDLGEKVINCSCAKINYGGDRAFYSPLTDEINMPPLEIFKSSGDFYGTMFHELAHWTGAPHRLKRDLGHSFGSKPYAFEELIAEFSAAFTCATLGILPTVRHSDYIGAWLSLLKNDEKAIFRAAAAAQRATDLLLEKAQIKNEEEEEEEEKKAA